MPADDMLKYIGASLAEATTLAAESGCLVRDMTKADAWYTSDERLGRINVWLNPDGRVEKALRG